MTSTSSNHPRCLKGNRTMLHNGHSACVGTRITSSSSLRNLPSTLARAKNSPCVPLAKLFRTPKSNRPLLGPHRARYARHPARGESKSKGSSATRLTALLPQGGAKAQPTSRQITGRSRCSSFALNRKHLLLKPRGVRRLPEQH